ncbi:MAG TPA: tryptophanase [Bdellovibrionota bacterium]|jgi:tryptophanase|nr:tryptophanase [Bdellovibrionota bacterium]
MNEFSTIIEPFRIKSVEPIKMTSAEDRRRYLNEAGLNPFLIDSANVLIDLLTDSGTTAMSTEQWAGVMRGDESYAGSPSYLRFEKALRDVTGHREIIPTHQGRAAERILFATLTKPGQTVISNMLFDTTKANCMASGCTPLDLPCPELANTSEAAPFKGNIDLGKLEARLAENASDVGCVVLTITNNSGGGQPASFSNIEGAAKLCKQYKVPFVVDGCRFAENAWFIKQREPGFENVSPIDIARKVFALADVISVSAKKDGMGNIGGFLTMNDPELAQACRNNLILTEGFPTYGGLSGRDLDTIAVGIYEALEPDYLKYRIQSIKYLGEGLLRAGVPIVNPPGGHAIYIDAKRLCPHLSPGEFPGQALVAKLYEYAGIRGVEIGSVMFGSEDAEGKEIPHRQELVRLAVPRRVYTQSHIDYVLEALSSFKQNEAAKLRGVKFTYKPRVLRHFTARFEWI